MKKLYKIILLLTILIFLTTYSSNKVTFFNKNNLKKYDVAVGMYHDQVLTPMKTLYNFNAINITLGLPFIRISPDHGPNNQMIGQNKSDPQSLISSINFLKKFK